jgi:hypothetical protein
LDWTFTGFLIGVEDGNSYIAKMMSGYRGDWLFRTTYAPRIEQGAFVYFPYILLGKLTAPPAQHEQMLVLYHLFRFIGGILAFMATYDFVSLFLTEVTLRRWATGLSLLGGGLGWLLVLMGETLFLGTLPLEFYSPEAFGFLALLTLPHIALGRALLLWGMAAYLRRSPVAVKKFRRIQVDKQGVLAGTLWFGLGLMQPLTVLVAWAVIASHYVVLRALILWQKKGRQEKKQVAGWALRAAWAGLVSSPLVLYTAIHFSLDPFLRVWANQNVLPSPHWIHYLLAYGWLLPFSVIGVRRLLIFHRESTWLPIVWVLVTPLLVSVPFSVQRRLSEGMWVALVVLGVKAFEQNDIHLKGKFRGPLQQLLIFGVLFISSLILFVGSLQTAWEPDMPVFRPANETKALTEVRDLIKPNTVILSAYESGNILPAWLPIYAVYGHSVESVGVSELEGRIRWFFSDKGTEQEKIDFLNQWMVDYVWWGPIEQAVGQFDPFGARYLQPVFQREGYHLYKVLR